MGSWQVLVLQIASRICQPPPPPSLQHPILTQADFLFPNSELMLTCSDTSTTDLISLEEIW